MNTVENNFGVEIGEQFDKLKQASDKQLKQIVSLEKSVACMKTKQEYLMNGVVSLAAVVSAELKRRDRTISDNDKTISDNNKIISDLKRELDELKCNRDLKIKADEEQENGLHKRMKFNDNNENRLPRVYNKNREFYNRGNYYHKLERSRSRENYRVAGRYPSRRNVSKAPKDSDNREHWENKFKDDEKTINVEDPYRVLTESYGGTDGQISRGDHRNLSKILTEPSENGTSRYRLPTKKLKFVEKLEKDYERKWSTREGKDKYKSRSSFDGCNRLESCVNWSKSESYQNRFDKQSEPKQTETKEDSRLRKKITRNCSFEEGEIRSDDEVYNGGFRHEKSFQEVKRMKRARSKSCNAMRCDDVEELTNANSCSDKHWSEPDKICSTKSISLSEYKNRMDSNKLNNLNTDTFKETQTNTKNPSEDTINRIQNKENKIVVLSEAKLIPSKSKAGHTKKKYENPLRILANTVVKQSEEYSGVYKNKNELASLDIEGKTEDSNELNVNKNNFNKEEDRRKCEQVIQMDVSIEHTRKISSKEDSRDKPEPYTATTEPINAVPASSSTPQHQASSEKHTTEVKERRRITPIPVKEKSVCTFTNILEKTTSTFTVHNTFQLTHDGEIPILHIEDNLSNLNEDGKTGDNSIFKLLDTMNISNIECDLTKFKTSDVVNLNNQLSFENLMNTVALSPLSSNSGQNGDQKNNQNITGQNKEDNLRCDLEVDTEVANEEKYNKEGKLPINPELRTEAAILGQNGYQKVDESLQSLKVNKFQGVGTEDGENVPSIPLNISKSEPHSFENFMNKVISTPDALRQNETATDTPDVGTEDGQNVPSIPLNISEREPHSFENFMNKVTSTPDALRQNETGTDTPDVGTKDGQNVPSIPLNISESEPHSFENFMNKVTSTPDALRQNETGTATPVVLRQNETGTDTDMQISNENLCRNKLGTVTGQSEIVITENNIAPPKLNLSPTTNDQICSKDLGQITSTPVNIASNPHEIGFDNANLLTNGISRINTDANTELNQNESNTSKGSPVVQSTNLSTGSNNSTRRRKRNRVVSVVVIQ